MTLTVTEMFYSIQGESSRSGQPFSFIRLTGCNLRCAWCDTDYAWTGGRPMAVSTILDHIGQWQCRRVAVTGGEPLMQPETPELINRLLDTGFQVVVETNGSIDIDIADSRSYRIMDIKCPSSGEHQCTDWDNLARLTVRDEIKFVIADAEDYAYAKNCLANMGTLPVPPGQVLFSTVPRQLAPKQLARWILEDRLDVRLQLQLHKHIWDPSERGV